MNSREIALISLFAAVWVISQIYLGPIIGQLTTLHGLVERFIGWFLMLILAKITGRFGRVSLMATVSALVTRMIRYSSDPYIWTVGLGYALGGLSFDSIYFVKAVRNLKGAYRIGYLFVASLLSGLLAIIPYVLFRLISLGFITFIVWLPVYLSRATIDVGLNILGTLAAIPILSRISTMSPILYVNARE